MSTTSSNTLRSQLFAAPIQRETVTVAELGLVVEVRGMSAGAKGRVVNHAKHDGETVDLEIYYPALLIETVYDPATGERLFTAGDAESIAAMPVSVVEQLAVVAQRLSGVSAPKVLEKNSEATDSVATSSASPNGSA